MTNPYLTMDESWDIFNLNQLLQQKTKRKRNCLPELELSYENFMKEVLLK